MFGNNSNRPITVCSFHQRGICKYGNSCWNYHEKPSGPSNMFGGGGGQSSDVFNRLGPNPNVGASMAKDFIEFMTQVSTEMKQWEGNGMWKLSTIGPLKDHPPIRGFVDTSAEEMRLEAYEAKKSNNLAQYQSLVKEKLDHHKRLQESLKNMTPESKEALKEVFYKNGVPSVSNAGASSFGKPATATLFGGENALQKSAFGNATTPLFGSAANSTFGGTTGQASMFGNSQTSTFGGAAAQVSAFGNTAASNSAFGGQKSVFGGSSAGNNTFGGSAALPGGASVFKTQNSSGFGTASTFGTANQPPQSGFGAANNNSAFGGSGFSLAKPTFGGQTSVFGTNNSTQASTFGSTNPSQASAFGINNTSQQPSTFGNNNSSAFGGINSSQTSAFGSTNSAFGAKPSAFVTGQSQSSPFGGGSSQSSVFGGSNNSQSTVFGAANGSQNSAFAQPTNNAFGAQNATFGSQSGAFGGTNNGANFGASGNAFGAAPTTPSAFGSPQATASTAFGNANSGAFGSTNQNVFGNTMQSSQPAHDNSMNSSPARSVASVTPSPFGNTIATNSTSTFSGNAFGSSMAPQPTAAVNAPQSAPNSGIFGAAGNRSAATTASARAQQYTPLDELQPEDRAEFEADFFTLMPFCPPPRELCI